jgi:murein DD-endopeptidase MepM/ murein hydrolase activator NlpD
LIATRNEQFIKYNALLGQIKAKETEVAAASAEMQRSMGSKGGLEAASGNYARVAGELANLKAQASAVGSSVTAANAAILQSQIPILDKQAEASIDGGKAAEIAYSRATDAAHKAYVAEMMASKTAADRSAAAVREQNAITAAINRKKAAEEAWAALEKDRKKGTDSNMTDWGNPLESMHVTSPFGARARPRKADGTLGSAMHNGVDLRAAVGTAVHAPQVGVVQAVGYSATEGKYVVLAHGAGVTSRYLHLSDNSGLTRGQEIAKGEVFAKTGNTGGVAPHLDYRVYQGKKAVNPLGNHPSDALSAEIKGLKDLEAAEREEAAAKKAAVDDKVAMMTEEQSAAGEDLDRIMEIQNQKLALIQGFYGEDSKEAAAAGREKNAIQKRIWARDLADLRASLQEQTNAKLAAAQEAKDIADIGTGAKGSSIDFQEQVGLINAKQAMLERAALRDEEYANEVNFQNAMYAIKMKFLQDELAAAHLPVAEARRINSELLALETDHQHQVAVLQARHIADVGRAGEDMAALQASKWKEMGDTVAGSLSSAFQGMWMHTQSLQSSMLKTADAIVFKFADAGLKMLEDWVMKQLGMTGATAAAAATQTGIKAAATATQTGIGAAGAMTELGQRAATSAAGAFSSTVVIPFIGPVAAPVAAAAALAAVLGFGALISARGGQGQVPFDGQMTELHKDEMVLPAWIASPLRDSLKAGNLGPVSSAQVTASAGAMGQQARMEGARNYNNPTFNYQPAHTHGKDTSLERLLQREGRAMDKWFKDRVRSGAFRGVEK